MSNNIEWTHAGDERPTLVTPEELWELAPDGNERQDWGVGSEGIMVYGSLRELESWLTSALRAVQAKRG